MSKSTILDLNSDNLFSFLESDGLKILQFWAEWCGPCRMMCPIVEEIALTNFDKFKIGKINIDDNEALAQKYAIKSIPTIVIVKNNIVLTKIHGSSSKEELLNIIFSYVEN